MAIASEFKFACPVCGQHITCDSRSSGTQVECPTCFRKLIVPQAPRSGSPNLVLTASEVSTRPAASAGGVEPFAGRSKRKYPVAALALVIVLSAVAGGGYVFRDQMVRIMQHEPPTGRTPAPKKSRSVIAPQANDANWTLDLSNIRIPQTPAAGRIHGEDFLVQRATLQGGTLNFRQGQNWPPELGLTVNLFANRSEDLAGQTIQIEATRADSPRVVLRWKDDAERPLTKSFSAGYALRLEFGRVSGSRMSGAVYLCTPDDAKSYVAGTFTAEIRRPSPAKTASTPSNPK
jgi:hypothetical protein